MAEFADWLWSCSDAAAEWRRRSRRRVASPRPSALLLVLKGRRDRCRRHPAADLLPPGTDSDQLFLSADLPVSQAGRRLPPRPRGGAHLQRGAGAGAVRDARQQRGAQTLRTGWRPQDRSRHRGRDDDITSRDSPSWSPKRVNMIRLPRGRRHRPDPLGPRTRHACILDRRGLVRRTRAPPSTAGPPCRSRGPTGSRTLADPATTAATALRGATSSPAARSFRAVLRRASERPRNPRVTSSGRSSGASHRALGP